MKKKLFYFAIAGWVAAIVVHIFSLTGINLSEKMPLVWVLHPGIFVVWIPAIISLNKNPELQKSRGSRTGFVRNPFSSFKIIFKNTPRWLLVIAIAGWAYSSISLWFSMTATAGTAILKDGQYILQNHGTFVKTLTEQEYNYYKAGQMRWFSGIWLAFYGLAMAILFPFNASSNIDSAKILKQQPPIKE